MVTWTATALGIVFEKCAPTLKDYGLKDYGLKDYVQCFPNSRLPLQRTRQRYPSERCAHAQEIVAQDVGEHQSPLALLEERYALEGITRECGKRSAKTDHHQ